MALLSPVYAVTIPFLFVVTVPLAVLAGLTTTLAFSVLMLRVLAVYLDIALSLLPRSVYLGRARSGRPLEYECADEYMSPSAAVNTSPMATTAMSSPTLPPLRRWRRRRSSTALSAGLGTGPGTGTATPCSDAGLGLVPSIGAERDFEGIGGWRVGAGGDDDDEDDAHWTTINSRLELPDRQHVRNHHRSASGGGPTPPGDTAGCLMMKGRTRSVDTRRTSASPNSSRVRTPSGPHISFSKAHSEGYFSIMAMAPKKKITI